MDTDNDHYEIDDRTHAQRDIIRQSLDEIANDIGMAMRDVGLTFPALHDRSKLWRRARDNCDDARSIRCRLAAGIGDRLSNYTREGRLRSVARANTALRYCERRGDKCRRRDCRLINEFDTNAGRLAFDGIHIPLSSGSRGAASIASA